MRIEKQVCPVHYNLGCGLCAHSRNPVCKKPHCPYLVHVVLPGYVPLQKPHVVHLAPPVRPRTGREGLGWLGDGRGYAGEKAEGLAGWDRGAAAVSGRSRWTA